MSIALKLNKYLNGFFKLDLKSADVELYKSRLVLIDAIREAIPIFSSKFPFFNEPDAILTAVETRTSSPLRIPRDKFFQSLNVDGLYPAGEGAGYAGGILSAGIDGITVAEAIALRINKDLSE